MLEIICVILAIVGVFLSIISFIVYNRVLKYSVQNIIKLPKYYNVIKNIIRLMMLFFMIGYMVGIFDLLTNEHLNPMFYFVVIVFFVAAVFIVILIFYMYTLTKSLVRYSEDLNNALSEIEKNNTELQAEVDKQVGEIIGLDKLLYCVNQVAAKLLSSNIDKFDDTLMSCLEDLGDTTEVDRITVWKNFEKDNKLHRTKIHEWKSVKCNCQPDPMSVNIPYDDINMDWKQVLFSGEIVSANVKDMNESEREIIVPLGIISMLVVPVFLHGDFWGYMEFDDCKKERAFNESQKGILKSAGIMIATSEQQNETMLSLVKAREEALLTTKSKSDFLSNMSHEIRTPINAITGMTRIAWKSSDIEDIKKCLTKIDTSSQQLLALINDILDISKIEAGKMELVNEAFNLVNTVSDVKSIIEVKVAEKRQKFILEIGDDVPKSIKGDSVRLSQVLLNLLSNAVKFTDEEGEIFLKIKNLGSETNSNIHTIKIEVTDSGIGIPEELQKNLFGAFEQAETTTSKRFGGTGLGLTISKQIIKLMNGDITVSSEKGKGSTFTAIFKAERCFDDELIQNNTTVNEKEVDLHGRSVMVVDDIEINRDIVESILSEKDMILHFFENGRAAVDAFKTDPDKYEIILMDVHMPLMDGYEATETIRAMNSEQSRKIPIIAMTANAFEDDIRKCKAAGMNDHISKPVDYNKLFEKMDYYLNHFN